MVRMLGNGQIKRSREEERSNTDTNRHSFAHHHSRHHRHSSLSSARDAETKDHDLEYQMEQLQTSLQNRLRSIRRREEACAAEARINQQRSQKLEDRQRQVSDREDAVKEQADDILRQQTTLRQLQAELLDQYNSVVASLPGLDDRLQAARQLLPEYATAATSSAKDASLDAAEAGSSLAPQQPLHSSLPQEAFSGQLAEGPGVAHCHLINSNAAAVPGTTPDVNGEDVKCSSQAETDSPCNAAQGGAHQPSATSDTVVTASSSDLPRKSVQEQLPTASPSEKLQAQLADASKQPSRLTSANQAEQPSLAAPQQQEPSPPPADQEPCAAEESSFKGADPSHHIKSVLKPEDDSATQSTILHSSLQPASSQQRPAQLPVHQSSKEHIVAEVATPASRNPKPSEQCTASEARPGQAEAGSVQTRHQRTRQGSHQAEAEAQAAAHVMVPSVMKLRTGLRSRLDSAAFSDKRGLASQVRAEPAHRKQAGVDTARNWPEVTYGSNRGNGRGRAYGRGGRRGRGRSNLFRTSHSEPQPAGDMDEAVQALKETTESLGPGTGVGPAASRSGGANALEDDELKPSFMRRPATDRSPPSHGRPVPTPVPVPVPMQALAHLPLPQTASEASSQDPNPRPATRRRTDSSKTTERTKAKAVMQKEVPDLLDILQQKGWAEHVDLLEHCDPDSVYLDMHSILSRLCEGKAGSWQGRNVTGKGVVMDGEESGKHEYCLLALEHLLERADAYSLNSEPVRWGWCRELSSFVFVFEGANRIVVEKPCYGHATYFFDLEEPLPVSSQVQRLIAILSVPGVSRRKLLEDSSLDPGPHLTQEEHKQLEAAGWKPGTTVRSLLNFTGDRIFHQSAEIMTGQKSSQRDVLDYKDKIAKVLSEGAGGGRVTKHLE